ncbi:MAG: hypothetical protein ACMG51_06830 [Ginsengibacter sp.]
MAADKLDISKVGNVVQITTNTDNPLCFSHALSRYEISNDGLTFSLLIGGRDFVLPFANLTISGAASANAAAAYTSLSTIFPS